MENPLLIPSFAVDGLRETIPDLLKVNGWSVSNPNVAGAQLNQLFFQLFGYLNFLKKKGISAYSSDEDYFAYNSENGTEADIVRDGNKIYFCKQDISSDSPKAPATNPDFWGVLFDFLDPIYEKFANYALNTHNHDTTYAKLGGLATQTFLVKAGTDAKSAVNKEQMENAINNINIYGLGIDQTWQDVTTSRVGGVTYTNTTGKPIEVHIQGKSSNIGDSYLYVDGVQAGYFDDDSTGDNGAMNVTVPNGSIYVTTATSFDYWAELR